MRFVWTLAAAVLPLAAATPAAADAAVSASWHRVDVPHWDGLIAGDGRYDLGAGVVTAFLAPSLHAGGWLRASATAPADTPDFGVWIRGYDDKLVPLSRPLPTTCRVVDASKTCANTAWVMPGAAKLGVTFWNGWKGLIVPGPVEFARGVDATPENEARYDRLADEIQQLYIDSDAVDWPRVRAAGRAVLAAPPDIDPLPSAIGVLIALLPKHQHMLIYRRHDAVTAAVSLPECKAIGDDSWKLSLPATPQDTDAQASYLASAHACLATAGVHHWLIDLSNDSGGDAMLQMAALQPVLGTGPQLKFRGAKGSVSVLELQQTSVTVDGVPHYHWTDIVQHVDADMAFVIGPRCASACEEVALAAKGRFRLVGQPTAGLTSVNETRTISDDLSVTITSGVAVDLRDRTFERIVPDVTLSAAEVAALLRTTP